MQFQCFPSRFIAFHAVGGLSAGPQSACPLISLKSRRWSMMAHVPKKRPRPRNIVDAISRSARIGDVAGLDDAVREARNAKVALNAISYTAVAVGLARGGEYRRCFETLAEMRAKKLSPTNATLRAVSTACVSWGMRSNAQRASARLALQEMISWFIEDGEPRAEVKSWNLVLSALAKLGARRRMLIVLRSMETLGGKMEAPSVAEPDVTSYNMCIAAAKYDGVSALRLFAGMLCRKRVKPDVVTFNILLKMGMDDDRFVMSFGSNERIPRGLAGDRVVQGAVSLGMAVLGSMRRQSVDPDLRTWTCLFRLVSRQAESTKVRTLVRQTIFDFWSSLRNSKNPVAPDLIVGNAHAAGQVLSDMQRRGVSADMYTMNSILTVLSQKGEVDVVLKVLDELRGMSAKLDSYSYIAALSSCGKCSPTRPEITEMILEDMCRDGVKLMPAMVNAAISSFGDRVDDAIRFWQKLRRMPQEHCQTAVKHVQTYEALFRVCGRAGRPDYGLKIFYAMKKAAEFNGSSGTNLFHSFQRGVREGKQEKKIGRVLARTYLELFRTECRAFVLELPVERIRIKY